MPNEGHPPIAPQSSPRALRRALIAATVVLAGGLLFAVIVASEDDGDETPRSESSRATATRSSPTTTRVDPEAELVSRLREILARRETAYNKRDPGILKEIYTVDCPCLKSDSNAIRELISEDYVWVGGETSVRVRRLEQVTSRMWTIIADFTSEPLRIETTSGRLVRMEPRGSELFQFVLARPMGATQWLLGMASSYENG